MQNTITSPYTFIPLNQEVHYPEWQKLSHDHPHKEGLTGTIDITLKNASPFIVGDQHQDKTLNFFESENGHPSIPGTSIKGMIRSIIEAATHSQMTQIHDEKLSFRDLNQKTYRDLLTQTLPNQTYKAKSLGGWLKFEQGKWQLYSCDTFRIENKEIEKAFEIQIKDKNPEKIYEKLKGIQTVKFNANPEIEHDHSQGNKLVYAKATDFQQQKANAQGYLVVTGQVSNKNMNFIFTAPQKPVGFEKEHIIYDFLQIVNKKDPQKKDPQKEDSQKEPDVFKYLKKLNHKNGIPVFYIPNEQGEAKVMGLAQMFRFPYDNSIKDMLPDSHRKEQGEEKQDFATLMFGQIGQQAKKGRVSFGLLTLNEAPQFLPEQQVVLGTPKPSFYPAYVNQKTKKNRKETHYNTYNNEHLGLAGRKQYLVHKTVKQKPVQKDQQGVSSSFIPLDKGHSFSGKIRFHNLLPQELGALVWALTLGEENMFESDYFHLMGYAKPLGYGKVQCDIDKLDIAYGKPLSQKELLNEFYFYQHQSIQSTTALEFIRAIHKQGAVTEEQLKYPEFGKPFSDIKKNGLKLPGISLANENKWYQQVSEGFAEKLQEINARKTQLAKEKQQKEKQRLEQERLLQERLKEEQRLASRSQAQQLIEDRFQKVLDKKSLELLSQEPSIWQDLPDTDKLELAQAIVLSEYFKQVKRRGIRKKFENLLALIDLAL